MAKMFTILNTKFSKTIYFEKQDRILYTAHAGMHFSSSKTERYTSALKIH